MVWKWRLAIIVAVILAREEIQEIGNSSQKVRDGIEWTISRKSEEIFEDAKSETSNCGNSVWHASDAVKHSLKAELGVQKAIDVVNRCEV